MRYSILPLLKTDNFVSGERIAETLGVSRAAVWKQIASLKDMGYEIESVKNKGYRIVSRPDVPIAEEVKEGLNTKIIGREIIYFKKISSTNTYARELINKGVEEGSVVVADVQTIGRGRKNRTWFSPEGGLWFSIILFPKLPPQRGMLLTMAASVSIVQGIKETTGLNSEIKWPNDVLINGKKVCGVLTELDAEIDRINYSIVGIGVNVNNKLDATLLNMATTVSNELGSQVSRVNLLRAILRNFDKNYRKLSEGHNEDIRDEWISMSNIINREIKIRDDYKTLKGIVISVDEDGSIMLKTDGRVVKVLSGDLEYL